MGKNFITGSTGFVGLYLTEYLTVRCQEVVGVSRKKNDISKTIDYFNFKSHLLSVGSSVIHLAGKAHDLKKVSRPSDYYEANYELTKQVYDTFLISDCSVFIFVSTVKAVADHLEGVLDEEAIPAPQTHYGIAKLKAEQYILSKKIPKGKRVYILRPCMIHGPGNKGNLNLLYKFVEKGLPWPLGNFNNQRSFLSIENLCFVINEILENETIPSGIYQIADDQPMSTNELIELIGESLDIKSHIWKVPTSFIHAISRLGDYLHFPLNSERLKKLTESYVISNVKIKSAIGKPLPVDAKQGIIRTFDSFAQTQNK